MRKSLLAVAAILPFLAGPVVAPSPASASSCSSGYCVWSGTNYTGTEAELQIPGLNQCFTAKSVPAIRSAQITGETYYISFYDNADCTGTSTSLMYQSRASFNPAKRGMKAS